MPLQSIGLGGVGLETHLLVAFIVTAYLVYHAWETQATYGHKEKMRTLDVRESEVEAYAISDGGEPIGAGEYDPEHIDAPATPTELVELLDDIAARLDELDDSNGSALGDKTPRERYAQKRARDAELERGDGP